MQLSIQDGIQFGSFNDPFNKVADYFQLIQCSMSVNNLKLAICANTKLMFLN